jgi:hypothetical protein
MFSHAFNMAKGCSEVRETARNVVIPLCNAVFVSIDIIEDGTPCDYCGTLIQFFDDDFTICPECGNEFWNMDYTGEFPGDRPDRA